MAKPRLRASVSPLLTRAGGFISGTISSKTSNGFHVGLGSFIRLWFRSISDTGTLANLQLERSESLCRSSSDEDDAFAELGTPAGVTQGVRMVRKLMTEKPELLRKRKPARKASPATHMPSDDEFAELGTPVGVQQGVGIIPKLKTENQESFKLKQKTDPARKASRISSTGIPPSAHNTGSPSTGHQLKNHHDVSRVHANNKIGSNSRSLNCIVVENIPSTVSNSRLKESVSSFGEVSNVSMTTSPNDLGRRIVEFKSIESCRKAVSVGRISLGSFHLPIRPLTVSGIAAIRISNISTKTTDPAIHSKCMSYGPLEGLVRKEEDVVDAFFTLKDNLDAQRILEKLNSTLDNDTQWSAHLQQPHMDVTNEEDGFAHCKLGSEISHRLADLRMQMSLKKIYAEDLDYLHSCIVHLESHPASIGKLPGNN